MKSVTDFHWRADPHCPALELWPEELGGGSLGFRPFIELYLCPGEMVRSMILIAPGGGYQRLRDAMIIEGHDVALKMNEYGFHAAVLKYRTFPSEFPAPLRDIVRALKILRGNAARWKTNPDQLAVAGFSAGGHLAACSGVLYDTLKVSAGDEYDSVSARPDALLLGYAVLNQTGKILENIAGTMPEINEPNFLARNIPPSMPPVFLHHAQDDDIIPVSQSLEFSEALKEKSIPCELHTFETGGHAYGIGSHQPTTRNWHTFAETWLNSLGFTSSSKSLQGMAR